MTTTGQLLACESFDITRTGLAHFIRVLSDLGVCSTGSGWKAHPGWASPLWQPLQACGHDVREASRTNDRRRRRHRAKTDITDAQAIAAETLADPELPPARKHQDVPPDSWETREQCGHGVNRLCCNEFDTYRGRTHPCSLPVGVRDQLPATSRVMAALTALQRLDLDDLTRVDQVRIRWLTTTLAAITSIKRATEGHRPEDPDRLDELGCTLTEIVGVGVVTAMTVLTGGRRPHPVHPRGPIRPMARYRTRGDLLG